MRILTPRELNRALLDRQALLERSAASPLDMLRQVAGLQSQAPDPPYVGLWTRLANFSPAELSDLIERRQAVRLALMRSTIHLVAAVDAWALRANIQPAIDKGIVGPYARALEGIGLDAVRQATLSILAEGPKTLANIAKELLQRFPDRDLAALSYAARATVPLVQPPPRGLWKAGGTSLHLPLDQWIPAPDERLPGLDWLVRTYLTAFGPASVMDMQAWSGLTRLRAVVDDMLDELVTYRDREGRKLFDLPGRELPGEDILAPIRFLPEWDTAILGLADRSRILPPEYFTDITTQNGIFKATVLVNGFVAGVWRTARDKSFASLEITLYTQVSNKQQRELEVEGERLLAFLEPEADRRTVTIDQ